MEGKIEHGAETEPNGKTLEFFGLSNVEVQCLQDEIERHGGLIRMFVHPDYLGYSQYEEAKNNKETAEKLRKMNEAFHRVLESSDDKTPPMVIIHGVEGFTIGGTLQYDKEHDRWKDSYEKAIHILEKQGDWADKASMLYKPRHDIYLIPAKTTSPTPLLAYAHNEEEAWEALIEEMKRLGVRKVIIGGAELYIPKLNDESEDHVPPERIMEHVSGCLGGTIRHMRNDFTVELSNLTYPEGRRQITSNPPFDF